MIISGNMLGHWRYRFLIIAILSVFSLYAAKAFSQQCNLAPSGDVICQGGGGGGGAAIPIPGVPGPAVTFNGATVFGGSSPLFSSFATTPGLAGLFVDLESLYDSVPDILKNLLISEALSILSGNDATAKIADLISNFQQINTMLNSFSGMSIGGIPIGGDLEAYAANNIVQQLSTTGDIASLDSADITDLGSNAADSVSDATSTVAPADISDCDSALLDIVQEGESTCAGKPPYDVVYSCATPMKDGRPLSQWTVAELQAWQAAGGIRIGGKVFTAAGRYQFIRSTLNPLISNAVSSGELRTSDLFDQNAQDLLAIKLADSQGGLQKYKDGQQSLERTIYKIATIWASLEYEPGKGVYDGDSVGNHAKAGTYNRVKSVLMSSACTGGS